MKIKPKITIADYFALIEDSRVKRTKLHNLNDIITIRFYCMTERLYAPDRNPLTI
jgi:hypothetical protein